MATKGGYRGTFEVYYEYIGDQQPTQRMCSFPVLYRRLALEDLKEEIHWMEHSADYEASKIEVKQDE